PEDDVAEVSDANRRGAGVVLLSEYHRQRHALAPTDFCGHQPSNAARSCAMSNFFICRNAAVTRATFAASASCIISSSAFGTTCHDRPNRSLTQPQGPS